MTAWKKESRYAPLISFCSSTLVYLVLLLLSVNICVALRGEGKICLQGHFQKIPTKENDDIPLKLGSGKMSAKNCSDFTGQAKYWYVVKASLFKQLSYFKVQEIIVRTFCNMSLC